MIPFPFQRQTVLFKDNYSKLQNLLFTLNYKIKNIYAVDGKNQQFW